MFLFSLIGLTVRARYLRAAAALLGFNIIFLCRNTEKLSYNWSSDAYMCTILLNGSFSNCSTLAWSSVEGWQPQPICWFCIPKLQHRRESNMFLNKVTVSLSLIIFVFTEHFQVKGQFKDPFCWRNFAHCFRVEDVVSVLLFHGL